MLKEVVDLTEREKARACVGVVIIARAAAVVITVPVVIPLALDLHRCNQLAVAAQVDDALARMGKERCIGHRICARCVTRCIAGKSCRDVQCVQGCAGISSRGYQGVCLGSCKNDAQGHVVAYLGRRDVAFLEDDIGGGVVVAIDIPQQLRPVQSCLDVGAGVFPGFQQSAEIRACQA